MKMNKGLSLPVLIIFLSLSSVCFSAESAIVKNFREALEQKDAARMNTVIKNNMEKIPSEVKALLDEALLPQTPPEVRESKFNLAERLARAYKNVSGDEKPLVEEQKRVFESYLSEPVSPSPVDGVHTIDIRHSEAGKETFTPNNIVIKKGDTVRWVNNNNDAHLLSTVSAISTGSMISPDIKPGKSWEHKFYKPGVYYYICCQHKEKMYGKITVE
jgi:plastocyanin